ncbi:orotidine-5'-phosphate decarboxylase [Flavihumibacter petaseus]|uniref:Orotidine-5'-phosphate decarboxylase n=1 Tax=Flavihumibacter petaseus NBRC 106054 TaxID=1220578 RepID=A0A0E9N6U7_9BACT|nr:orotidine-5'-phosphate decarboxylase [Flavihumibacter petaseus]GAO45549.1 orotidine 5'-phosphate decarboxylase [Flavihumibacter petaseus NBRC 106054]
MNRQALVGEIRRKQSFLCVGLDTDPGKLPAHLKGKKDGVLEFNRCIIDATKAYCVAYKINTAFYEAMGSKGWEIMEATLDHIPDEHFAIADAKRGDIGNTSHQYARAFFKTLSFDAITVAPYMGADSVMPFLEYENKWTIVLGLTSNPGAHDFELQRAGEELLYEKVLRTVSGWGNPGNLMFVIGATRGEEFENVRKLIPEHFLLVPGVGAQGGSLQEIASRAMNSDAGLLVNASRAILFADSGENFAKAAETVAQQYQSEMAAFLLH